MHKTWKPIKLSVYREGVWVLYSHKLSEAEVVVFGCDPRINFFIPVKSFPILLTFPFNVYAWFFASAKCFPIRFRTWSSVGDRHDASSASTVDWAFASNDISSSSSSKKSIVIRTDTRRTLDIPAKCFLTSVVDLMRYTLYDCPWLRNIAHVWRVQPPVFATYF